MVLDAFDHAFLINAKGHIDRLEAVLPRLAAVGIQAEVIEGPVFHSPGPFNYIGERGCLTAHHRCVREALIRGYKRILILEDDVVFADRFIENWDKVKSQVKRESWGLFYFYTFWSVFLIGRDTRLTRVTGELCTHAYAVDQKYYSTYLDTLTLAMTQGTPVDRALATSPDDFDSRYVLAVHPPMVGQVEGTSIIQGVKVPERWTGNLVYGPKEEHTS